MQIRMTSLKNSKRVLVIFLIIIIVYVLFLLIANPGGNQKKQPASLTPIPVPSDFTRDYSRFNKIKPGKSNLNDVKTINGAPFSTSVFGNTTTLRYATPSRGAQNTVVLENGVVKYAIENVFGDYRGTYRDYVQAHGQPDLHLFNSSGDLFEWFVFLRLGVGIENSAGGITKIIYFIPQSKENFIEDIANELGASENLPTRYPEVY